VIDRFSHVIDVEASESTILLSSLCRCYIKKSFLRGFPRLAKKQSNTGTTAHLDLKTAKNTAMKSQRQAFALFAIAALPSALAWGDLGHETIAYIATNFGMKTLLNDDILN
jgi:hypothetical protein